MEDKIIETFDNLTIEQTTHLLDDNIDLKINGRTFSRIKNKVYKKIGLKTQKRIYIQRRLAACAMVIVVLFSSLALVGFDNVAAMIENLFTFIPGIGIEPKVDEAIYTIEPVVIKTQADDMTASIIRAVYLNDYLSVTVEVKGKAAYLDGFTFYINKVATNYSEDIMHNLYVASDSTMLDFSCKIEEPKKDDVYEIAVNGFSERLAFKMTPCYDVNDFKMIGSTDMQNGISITATAQRLEDELIIWAYPFKTADAVKDTLLGYGSPSFGSYYLKRFIETESEKVYEDEGGWKLSNRFVFKMPESYQKATLHLPYLAMLREEKTKLDINLPSDYGIVKSDVVVKTSLGTIKVVEVNRVPSEYTINQDRIIIKFEYESKDSNMLLSSFDFEDIRQFAMSSLFSENGNLECLFVDVDKSQNDTGNDHIKLSLDITQLSYYLFGEYVIPLEIE